MIYFLALREGGEFIRIERKDQKRPKDIVKMLSGEKFAAIFKCGMIYDNFFPSKYKKWRHCLCGGRRFGRQRYNELLNMDLPTEYISFPR
jgi:hypothetical protein